MSTELFDDDDLGVSITRFAGGKARGPCLQITETSGATGDYETAFVQLSIPQLRAIMPIVREFLEDMPSHDA